MVIRLQKCIVCEKPFIKRERLRYPRQTYKGKSVGRRNQITCSSICSKIYLRIYKRILDIQSREIKRKLKHAK